MNSDKVGSPALYLRKRFTLTETPSFAVANMVGLGCFVWYLNGKRVGDRILEPAFTDYNKSVLYSTFVVTELLQEGENVIDVLLGDGWYNQTMRDTWGFFRFPEDCSHREKNGWTGDAQLSSTICAYTFDMQQAYRKWIEDILENQRASGQISGIIPSAGWGFNWGSGPAWDYALFALTDLLHTFYADEQILEKAYPAMRAYYTYIAFFEREGLLCVGLGDWNYPKKIKFRVCPTELTDSCYFMAMSEIMAKTAARFGEDPAPYQARATRTRAAILEKYAEEESLTGMAALTYFGILDRRAEVLAYMASVGDGKEYASVSFGMFIAPTIYTEKLGDLSYDNLFGIGGTQKYDWADEEGEYTESDKYRIINLYGGNYLRDLPEADKMEGEPTDGLKVFHGSVINMKPANLLTDYVGVGYVCATTAEGATEYKLATPNDNERSVVYVAQKAIEAGNARAEELKTAYLTEAVTATQVSVAKEYYLEQADGSYVKDSVNSTAMPANINVDVAIDDLSFEGYKFDSAHTDNLLNAKAYANGTTALKRYYKIYKDVKNEEIDVSAYADNGAYSQIEISTEKIGVAPTATGMWAKIGQELATDYVTIADGKVLLNCEYFANTKFGDYTLSVYSDRGTIEQLMHVVTKTITTAEQFMDMDSVYGNTAGGNYNGYFVLGNDIDFAGADYIRDYNSSLQGTFDGNGYSLKNFCVVGESATANQNGGLFGTLGWNGVIKNVTIKDFNVKPSINNASVNVIANEVFGTIENMNVILEKTDVTVGENGINVLNIFGYQPTTNTKLTNVNVFVDLPKDELLAKISWAKFYIFAAFAWSDDQAATTVSRMEGVTVVGNLSALAGTRGETLEGAVNNVYLDAITASVGTTEIMSKGLATGMSFALKAPVDGVTMTWSIGGETVTRDITVTIS